MNKTSDLESILLDYDPDCVILTETWLHVEIPDESVIPPSYVMFAGIVTGWVGEWL